MKTAKAICKKCGEIEISGHWMEAGEEGFIVPLILAPTIQALGKIYKDYDGHSYERATGVPLGKAFEIDFLELLHTNPDEDGEDWAEHTLQPMKCWREQL
jgi:NMD protein affecting ribosome stability and mRNA decay